MKRSETAISASVVADYAQRGITVDGSSLKIDITLGFAADPEFHNKLAEVINGHVSTVEKSTVGLGKTFLVVDLLKFEIKEIEKADDKSYRG